MLRVACQAFLICGLLLAQSAPALPTHPLPQEVTRFIEERTLCDHFRQEPWDAGDEPANAARRAFLAAQMQAHCTGTAQRLNRLRAKHRHRPEVIDALKGFDDQVE